MATTWTEENIGSNRGYDSDTTYDGPILYNDGTAYTKENLGASTWTAENATVERWVPEGSEIYLATEGEKAYIMSEGELEYLMYSRIDNWIEDVLNSASWTKLNIE